MTLMQKKKASRTNISFFQESLERNMKQTNIVVPLKSIIKQSNKYSIQMIKKVIQN